MTLKQICELILDVEEKLMYGQISFNYDSLMSAMKPGHPCEILDEILSEIFWDIQCCKTPDIANVRNVRDNLISFKDTFRISELDRAISELTFYVGDGPVEITGMTLSKLRKKYVGRPLIIEEVKEYPNCWHINITNGRLTFQFYWQDLEDSFLVSADIGLFDDRRIKDITPPYCERLRPSGKYSHCRSTSEQYNQYDLLLEAVTDEIEDDD